MLRTRAASDCVGLPTRPSKGVGLAVIRKEKVSFRELQTGVFDEAGCRREW